MEWRRAAASAGVLLVVSFLLAGCVSDPEAPSPEEEKEDEPEAVESEIHVAEFSECDGVDLEFPEHSPYEGPFTPVPSVFGVLYSSFLPIFDCEGLSLGDEQEDAVGGFLGLAEVEPFPGATLESVDAYYWFDFASTGSEALRDWFFLSGVYGDEYDAQVVFSDVAVFPDARAAVTISDGGQRVGGAESLALGSPHAEAGTLWGLYVYDWDNETVRLHSLSITEHDVTPDGAGSADVTTPVLSSHRRGFDMEFELNVIDPVPLPAQK